MKTFLFTALFLIVFASPTYISDSILTNSIAANDSIVYDQFGLSCAIFNNTLVVGAPGYNSNTAGHIYIFQKNGLQWRQVSKLTAIDAKIGDSFGTAVDIHDNFIIVGSRRDTDDSTNTSDQPIVYILHQKKSKDEWNQIANFSGDSNCISNACLYGASVSMSSNFAIVGSCGERIDQAQVNGAAYIYEYICDDNDGIDVCAWIYTVKLRADIDKSTSFKSNVTGFGSSVSIDTTQSNFAVVGNPYGNGINSIKSAGNVYVFEYNKVNKSWTKSSQLFANDGEEDDCFGSSVDIDNNRIIVGASRADGGGGTYSGSVYIFEFNSTNNCWDQTAKLTASDGDAFLLFGSSVVLSGSTAIIASSGYRHKSVYIFKFITINDTSTKTDWVEAKKLRSMDGETSKFGWAIDIYGNTTVISDPTQYFGTVGGKIFVGDVNEYLESKDMLVISIDYDYPTNVDIYSIDTNDNENKMLVYSIDECFETFYDWDINGVHEWNNFKGCFEIEFSDCDDSVINDRTNDHGIYEIIINGEYIGGYGGYYTLKESQIVCTDDYDHVSYCITPKFCSNNNHLSVLDSQVTDIQMVSYKSMVNCSIIKRCDGCSYMAVYCSGDHSCYDSMFNYNVSYVDIFCTI